MNGPELSPRTTTGWDTFVLASCARLARFPQVHLVPRFPPDRFNLAMRTQLPLQENELLVALIDSDAGGFQSEIILTTTRLYWFQREIGDSDGRTRKRSRPPIRAYGADYALVPVEVPIEPIANHSVQICLGAGRAVPIQGGGRELAEALADYLRTVGDESRKGSNPSLERFESELIDRISHVLPKVADVTRRTRVLNHDLSVFRHDLMAATPHVVVTPSLIAACILVFVVMVLRGVDPFLPSALQLLPWGANDDARVVLRHESWRLLASVFIHGGILHLALNMWCLFNIGPLVEKLFGNVATAVLFLAAGVGGAIASVATPPVGASVGASGAIFGLLGSLLAFLLVNRHSVPGTVLRPLRSSALSFVVFNIMFAAAVPIIDQSAHIGGLVTGFVGGLMLIRPWPVTRSRWVTLRRLAMGVMLVSMVVAAGFAALHWREQTLPATTRFADFNDQAATAIDEINAVSQAMPDVQKLVDQATNEESRRVVSGTLQELLSCARANQARLDRILTPDPSLREIWRALLAGQTAQTVTLTAELEYLKTRKSDCLTRPDGVLASQAASMRAARDFQNRERAFLETHKLIARAVDPGKNSVTTQSKDP